jgi:hypothetical protein
VIDVIDKIPIDDLFMIAYRFLEMCLV